MCSIRDGKVARIDTYLSDVKMVNAFFVSDLEVVGLACIFARVKDERPTLRLVSWQSGAFFCLSVWS